MSFTRAQWLRLSPTMRQHAARLLAQLAMLRAEHGRIFRTALLVLAAFAATALVGCQEHDSAPYGRDRDGGPIQRPNEDGTY